MPGVFVSSTIRAEVPPANADLQTPRLRFPQHERAQLLLARGVSPQLVELLEVAGFTSMDAMRQMGAAAVMVELSRRLGTRTRGFSPRALARALASSETAEAARATASAHRSPVKPARSERPLMADIARAAGVAPSTVSRALDDSDRVSERTKARIRELAQATHYARNTMAQSLRTRRVRTVMVMVPEADSSDCRLGDVQDLALIASLADALNEAGFDLNLSRPRVDRMAQVRDTVSSGRAAGLIVLGTWPAAPCDLPVVCFGSPGLDQTCPTVRVDASEGTRLATRLLLDQGARSVSFLADRHARELQAQRLGYLQAHRELGLAPGTDFERDQSDTDDCVAYLRRLASSRQLDGVVAASDWSALAAIESLRGAGLNVPRDLSVVGFGDTPLAVRGSMALTTVQWPTAQAAQALVRLLVERLAGRRPDSVILKPRLILRASTMAQ